MRDRTAVVLVLAAGVLWGTTGTARALAPADAAPLSVGAARIVLGGAVLVLVALGRGTLRTRWPVVPSLLAATAVAVYQPAFFEGVARAGVAAGTIVAIGSAPVFAGVLGRAVLGEALRVRWMVATALAIAGVSLLATPREGLAFEPLALALPLVAGAGYAAYATATKSLLAGRDPIAVAAVAFGLGGVLLLPVLALTDRAWLTQPAGIAVTLELGLVATAAAYMLFASALARIPVAWGATLSLMEPLTAAVLATIVLGETWTAGSLAGAALVAAGLAILATAPRAS